MYYHTLLYSFRLYSRLYSKKRAVERYLYSVPSSDHAPPELYSLYSQLIQLYTALYSVIQRLYKDCILYSYTAYTLYSAIL